MAISLTELKDFVTKHGAENTTLNPSDLNIFERYSASKGKLDGMAKYDGLLEKFSGAKTTRIDAVKSILETDEFLKDLSKDVALTGDVGAVFEKGKAKLTRNATRLFQDLEAIDTQLTHADGKLAQDTKKAIEEVTKAFTAEREKLAKDLHSAVGDAQEPIKKQITEMGDRYSQTLEAIREAAETKKEYHLELRDAVKDIRGGMEKSTGMKAAEVVGGTSHAAKVAGAAESAAKAGEKGLVFWMKNNPGKTAIGAVVAGALAMSLMGGRKEQSASR